MRSVWFTIAVVLLLASRGIACSCAPPPEPLEAMRAADAVFVGTLTSLKTSAKTNLVTAGFKVAFPIKNADREFLSVTTPASSAQCGYTFHKDESYLVYAVEGGASLSTNISMRTRPARQASREIAMLKPSSTRSAQPTTKQAEAKEPSAIIAGLDRTGARDTTSALQQALDAVGAAGGGTLGLPTGKYLIKGSLSVPEGVTLQGPVESPQYIKPLTGAVILATGGRDREDGPPLFEVNSSAAVRGVTVFYPEQKPRDIHLYPWTFHLKGGDNTIENVTLINSYNGIKTGPDNNVRHRIRSVYGCVLRRGIFVDACTDIGRIENVQFHCHWWSAPETGGEWDPVFEYMWRHCEAFIFARTDWEYVTNTFVFPVNIGYHFILTEHGACNGQFSGIGADASQKCVVVDALQPMGLLITNGQFVAFNGDDPVEVVINNTNTGSVRLVNCAFWGPAKQNVVSHSQSFVSLNDCYFSSSGQGRTLVEADSGRLQVRGCSFATGEPSIALLKGLKHAIVTENNGSNGVGIVNEIGSAAIIANNEPRD